MKWVETYKINANDADVNDAVSASGVLRYMQDTANCQMQKSSTDISSGCGIITSAAQTKR